MSEYLIAVPKLGAWQRLCFALAGVTSIEPRWVETFKRPDEQQTEYDNVDMDSDMYHVRTLRIVRSQKGTVMGKGNERI